MPCGISEPNDSDGSPNSFLIGFLEMTGGESCELEFVCKANEGNKCDNKSGEGEAVVDKGDSEAGVGEIRLAWNAGEEDFGS